MIENTLQVSGSAFTGWFIIFSGLTPPAPFIAPTFAVFPVSERTDQMLPIFIRAFLNICPPLSGIIQLFTGLLPKQQEVIGGSETGVGQQ